MEPMATFRLNAKAVIDEAVEIASPHERRDLPAVRTTSRLGKECQ
jgi:hypothetical protein